MSGRTTRGIRHPTTGARSAVEASASSTSSQQILAQPGHRSDSDDEEEGKEDSQFYVDPTNADWPQPLNSQIVGGVVVPLATDLAKKSTAKHTKDTKWTTAMEEKLVAAVYAMKAHIITDVAKNKK